MHSLEQLRGVPHTEASAWLIANGWIVCGVGDWATAWRSPDGAHAARVSPFELAYGVFVELCQSLAHNPLLPRIDLDVPLAGGGRLTVMEFLAPTEHDDAVGLGRRWVAAAEGDPITEVREKVDQLNAQAAKSIPFWGGLDDNPHNVMKDSEGAPKLVDLFYVKGAEIYRLLRENPSALAGAIAPDQREYICDTGALVREFSAGDIEALRANALKISRDQGVSGTQAN